MSQRGKGKLKVLPKTLNDGPSDEVPRLDRQIQARIGEQLRSMYDELLHQPIPDRFADLLGQLDADKTKRKSGQGGEDA